MSTQPHPMVPVRLRTPTVFGEVKERAVTFLVDTSGSMYYALNHIKEHLIETLLAHSEKPDAEFNIVEFNSEVTQFSDRMMPCSEASIVNVMKWLQKIECKGGTNTLDALTLAYADVNTQALYLITDSLPDQFPTDVLDTVTAECEGRAVHCVYCAGRLSDPQAEKFLDELARITYGSLRSVSLTNMGKFDQIELKFKSDAIRTDQGVIYPNERQCSMTTSLTGDPRHVLADAPHPMGGYPVANGYPLVPYGYPSAGHPAVPYGYPTYNPANFINGAWPDYVDKRGWVRFHTARQNTRQQPESRDAYMSSEVTAGPAVLLLDKRVLARRLEDGFFYLSTVKSEVTKNRFLVQFDACKKGKFRESTYQESWLHDIISHVDALRHTIQAGDHVLAPYESQKYAPGIVLDGHERRNTSTGCTDREPVINFYCGLSKSIPKGNTVWINTELHNRVVFELKLPYSARKTMESHPDYPRDTLPGYPTEKKEANPNELVLVDDYYVGHPPGYYPGYLPVGGYVHPYRIAQPPYGYALPTNLPQPGAAMWPTRDAPMARTLHRRRTSAPHLVKSYEEITGDTTEAAPAPAAEPPAISDDEEADAAENITLTDDDFEGLSEEEKVETETQTLRVRRRRKPAPKEPWRYWKQLPTASAMNPNLPGTILRDGCTRNGREYDVDRLRERTGPNGVQWPSSCGSVVRGGRQIYDKEMFEYLDQKPRKSVAFREPSNLCLSDQVGEKEAARDRWEANRCNWRQESVRCRNDNINGAKAYREELQHSRLEHRRSASACRVQRENSREAEAEMRDRKTLAFKQRNSQNCREWFQWREDRAQERDRTNIDCRRKRLEGNNVDHIKAELVLS